MKPEDGGKCPCKDCGGKLVLERVVNCSCHINPPCNACLDRIFICEVCGWSDGDPVARCSEALMRKIESKLRKIAKVTQELHDLARTEFPKAYVYFEAEGSAHLMDGEDDSEDPGRQKHIVASSPYFQFDCGAW